MGKKRDHISVKITNKTKGIIKHPYTLYLKTFQKGVPDYNPSGRSWKFIMPNPDRPMERNISVN